MELLIYCTLQYNLYGASNKFIFSLSLSIYIYTYLIAYAKI